MEIHFQTTDHVVAVAKVAERHIGTKCSKCNSLGVISHIIILGKSAISHSKVATKSSENLNFFPLAWDTLVLTCGSKISSKLLYLL